MPYSSKTAVVIVFAFALGACSKADHEKAQADAHRTFEAAKADVKKADQELDKDLHKAREKMRDALK
jgi:Tfp pilus assembly protein PilF